MPVIANVGASVLTTGGYALVMSPFPVSTSNPFGASGGPNFLTPSVMTGSLGSSAVLPLIVWLSMIFVSINVAAFKYIPPICAGRRSACSPCSATRGAASGRRWPRPSSGGGNISIHRVWANSSTRSTPR
jgi:hypothetical protein